MIIVTALATIAAMELALRLPLARGLRNVTRPARRAAAVISSKRISDHWKEKAVQAYAVRLFTGAIAMAAMIVAFLGLYVMVFWAAGALVMPEADVTVEIARPWSMMAAIVIATIYIPVRQRLVRKSPT